MRPATAADGHDASAQAEAAAYSVAASRIQLPPGPWTTVLGGLCARFPKVSYEHWLDRIVRGRVLDAQGDAIAIDTPYRVGAEIRYFREVADEPAIAGQETVLHVDAHLVVVDKPHFLPVVPSGRFVRETLLARLLRRLGNPHLAPLHRLDRDTAGLVMFSANPDTRAVYHALFRKRLIVKHYQAIAPPLHDMAFPLQRCSHIARGEPFFRMREVADTESDSSTRIDVLERGTTLWRYALQPMTGRKHQLRVHMAALGAPIVNDRCYPTLCDADDDDARPLQLLASALAFDDPLDGRARRFDSALRLQDLD
ncbi:MAG: pseudouridine synthase [Luteimonas sp.]